MSVFSDEYGRLSSVSNVGLVSDSPFVWESGTIVPVWKAVERHSIQEGKVSYVVPMLSSVRYYASDAKGGRPARCEQNLLISKHINTGQTSLGVVFYIPDNDLRRSRSLSDLSGLLVYTDLRGKFKKIEKYIDGEIYDGVYFGERESEIARERHQLFINRIMEGLTVFKVDYLHIETRCPAPGDTVEINDEITTPSYCNGNCFLDLWWQNPDFNFENDTTAHSIPSASETMLGLTTMEPEEVTEEVQVVGVIPDRQRIMEAVLIIRLSDLLIVLRFMANLSTMSVGMRIISKDIKMKTRVSII